MKFIDQLGFSERRGARRTKRLSNVCASSERRGARTTQAGGWVAIAFGAVHMVVASLDTSDIWSQVADDGWWNTFSLDESTTLAQFERSEAFWVTLGSAGAPLLILGCYVVWATRRDQRVPRWIGWLILAWGLPFVITLPASPGWAVPLIGGLLVLGDRRRSAEAAARPHAL